ncbi:MULTISPECIES: hypothetical protein [Chryseobacterium]|uniref:Guanylate cyclase domain-containing protein n=1 Tax=Chryseobacterium camelliae TaxID=1265445 RepID=A0ABU0TR10_9FLAO|nr:MULTISPECIES: hypothetical protein [Chryseobacterium]MDT3407401.1 hypothetical protein [Pseudacidovorax intermedius]MDQ1098750.1 hypothetical protein [Chryseobacterium camelliae]MDQ1102674.1 hypothetical protein [Chryseobacterium sp. SORGH_AS_1048]MDR6086102.1 hypothetical protein [Chryseobacterium sp. SORGH_AS_0909]MDR6130472.1 hypothetical protein [Chryseobacterium sp. SORGH_AS_1175]
MANITINVLSKAQTEVVTSINSYEDDSNWEITDNRFVAFFDILGFKEMVLRNTHEEIFGVLNNISELKNSFSKDFINSEAEKEPIRIITFSDSIIIFSKNASTESFIVFLKAINWLFAGIINTKIAIKGAFSHGLISANFEEQIFFGQSYIDAFLLQEEVNYMGVVGHHSIDKYINDKEINIEKLIIEMQTPLKSGKIRHLNLNYFPFIVYEEIDKMDEVLNRFKDTASGSPRKYLENTLSFLKDYKEIKVKAEK